MFCPKCGTKNPDDGKFCRSCGVDLANVSAALSGDLTVSGDCGSGIAHLRGKQKRRSDPNEVYGDSIKSMVLGFGFLIVSVVLFMTGVAGGHTWWWAMLFPAFALLSKGISDFLKSKKMERSVASLSPRSGNMIGQPQSPNSLRASHTEYVEPESRFNTGDLVPASVTDNTTKHLEMNSEGETMTLPKK